ncbi:bifunctional 3-(3-hydroxy-phenyl)propionate/3-hydroxycinnamic acid hydroxylase MhpA [Pseudomonas zhanjiangensis]|uniref:Bifunctional 3-(3-hydroxy-phenyl)propionate/3-hydroxycinnamic acid hydroxylase n=1 Tax=Pseudomonas zhanjiangensis TaxID=3239015 RepID=A0ABV3YTA7_9PSED
MASQTGHFDVVIIGAGPCGVTAANLLGSQGIDTLVVDKAADVLPIPRAIGMCNEGARILQGIGLYQRALQDMRLIDKVRFLATGGQEIFHADTGAQVNGFAEQHMFYQPHLERQLRDGLQRHPSVQLETACECLQIDQLDSGVRLWLKDAQGRRRQVTCQYLLAADGARSTVRKVLGLDFKGKTYAQDWLILDVGKDPCPNHELVFLCDPRRPGVTMSAPFGKRRWEFLIKDGESHQQMLSDASVRQLLEPWGDAKAMQVERRAVYTFHARVAERFRDGRVFLLGDAAHITPPFAGQGMMAGLRDAHNLSWKLAAVLRGRLGEQILDSYDRERRPQARQVIDFARFVGVTILPQRRWSASLRDGVFRGLKWLGLHSENKGLRLKKPCNHINGSRWAHLWRGRALHLGIEIPQQPLFDEQGRVVSLDAHLAGQFHLIGADCDPLRFLADSTLQRWRQLDGRSLTIASRPKVGALSDSRGDYRWLAGRRPVVLVRPDRMMVLRCSPRQLDRQLNRYLDSIGCQPELDSHYLSPAY